MIQPTRRAIVLVAAAAPLSLAIAALDAGLWPIGLTYLLFVLMLIAFDSARALPARRLTVSVKPVDSLFIGERANLEIALVASGQALEQPEDGHEVPAHARRPPADELCGVGVALVGHDRRSGREGVRRPDEPEARVRPPRDLLGQPAEVDHP